MSPAARAPRITAGISQARLPESPRNESMLSYTEGRTVVVVVVVVVGGTSTITIFTGETSWWPKHERLSESDERIRNLKFKLAKLLIQHAGNNHGQFDLQVTVRYHTYLLSVMQVLYN
ncbi:hypothetical protein DPMN_021372 [Dreissena polymorpha]|uniref:Uncharacterized protein n=1 Tax=Dreissena polymorpha TaxID=45954 RepID=A0A9D4NIF4_DREPO|nr:hypothetical protein DPMN_021372 [Dreissena polymorpha]